MHYLIILTPKLQKSFYEKGHNAYHALEPQLIPPCNDSTFLLTVSAHYLSAALLSSPHTEVLKR